MSYDITMLEGYGTPRFTSSTSRKKESGMKLGTAARACKGKKGGKFRKCVKQKMRSGRSRRRSRRSRR